MAGFSILDALKGVDPAEAMPFGAAATPQGSSTALSGMLGGIMNIPKRLIDAAREAPPIGLRREDFTDDPNAAQPHQNLVNESFGAALSLAGMGAPAAEAGAAGIFGGKLAKTADIDKLIFANKMREAGMPREQIWDSTGWMKDPADKKWKFEIPDDTSRLINHGLDYGQDVSYVRGPAEAMVQHPELFKAYPDLRNVDFTNAVLHNPENGLGQGQYFNRAIVAAAPDAIRAKNVAVHELQHGVQEIEKFAQGGNPSWIAKVQENTPSKIPLHELESDPLNMYHRLAGEVESRNVQNRMNFSPETRRLIYPWQTADVPASQRLVINPRSEMITALRHIKANE